MLRSFLMKSVLTLTLMVGLMLNAAAISFTGFSYSGPGSMSNSALGSDGQAFTIQLFDQEGIGSTTAQIQFTVSASLGFYLTGVTLAPNGTLEDGASVGIQALHPTSTTAVYSQVQNGTAPVVMGSSFTSLAGTASTYSVTMNLTLTGAREFSYGKVSVMQVIYQQQPVPEPATMTALALGAAALIRRKKGAKN